MIYICGGSDGLITNICESFNTATFEVRLLRSMLNKREEHSIIMGPDNKLYAIGGFDGKVSISLVERYDFQLGTWGVFKSPLSNIGFEQLHHLSRHFSAVKVRL